MRLSPETLAAHAARKFPPKHQPAPIKARLEAAYPTHTLAPDPQQAELPLAPCNCSGCQRKTGRIT